MSISEQRGVWVFIDRRDERLLRWSLSALGKAKGLGRELGAPVVAVLFGDSGAEDECVSFEPAAEECISHGADYAVVVDGPSLAEARADVYARALAELVRERDPLIVILALTGLGREISARAGRILSAGVIADAERLLVRDGRVICECPAWGGDAIAEIYFEDGGTAGFVTVSTHGVGEGKERGEPGEVIRVDAPEIAAPAGARLISSSREPEEVRRLEDAEVVVVGGAGLGSAAGFDLVRELARVLGGEVGATRPPALSHWVSEERMIGQTGRSIRPRLLITAGTSGATQYTAGIMESETIVAINRDPGAPIFEIADVGVVADAKTFVPLLTEKLKLEAMRGLAGLVRGEVDDGEGGRAGMGLKIRRLRETLAWSASELSEATGKDPDFIERVEAGEVTPSVSFLLRLAKALGVDPSAFLSAQDKSSLAGEREKAFTTRTQNYSYQTLTPGTSNERLRGFMITIEPKQAHKPVAYKHEGEEFVYVLEGELELTLGGKSYHLKPGESRHFDSDVPHKLKSLSDQPTRCLVMLYTP